MTRASRLPAPSFGVGDPVGECDAWLGFHRRDPVIVGLLRVHQHLDETGIHHLALLLRFATNEEIYGAAATGLGGEHVDQVRFRLDLRVLSDGAVNALGVGVQLAHPFGDRVALVRFPYPLERRQRGNQLARRLRRGGGGQRCGGRRADAKTRPTDGVLVVLELERHGQHRAAVEADVAVEVERCRLGLARRVAGRPAGLRIVVDGGSERMLGILRARLARLQLDIDRLDLRLHRGAQGRCDDADLTQHETSFRARAGARFRQTLVGESFEPQRLDLLLHRVGGNGVDLVLFHRILLRLAHAQPTVSADFQLALRLRVERHQRQPRRLRLGLVLVPERLQILRQRPLLELVAGLQQWSMGDIERVFQLLVAGRIGVDLEVGRIGAARVRDQAIIILLRDRIVLVIVAAGAAERQAEHRRAERGDHVVEMIVADQRERLGGRLPGIRARDEEAGRGDRRASRPAPDASPAICQRTNWSNGMSWFSALMTKSR